MPLSAWSFVANGQTPVDTFSSTFLRQEIVDISEATDMKLLTKGCMFLPRVPVKKNRKYFATEKINYNIIFSSSSSAGVRCFESSVLTLKGTNPLQIADF